MNHPDLSVRFAAIVAAEEHSYARPLPDISPGWIDDLMARQPPDAAKARSVAARALPLADPQRVPVPERLRNLLEDSNPVVVNEALQAAGKIQSRELVALLIHSLAKRTTRSEAREALLSHGPRIVGTLGDYLGDPNEQDSVRRLIPRLLGHIATPEAANILVRHLSNSTNEMRFQILKALNRIRRDHPEVPISGDVIDGEILQETKRYYQLLLSRESDKADEGPGRMLLVRTLEERLDQTLERIFRLLGLRYPLEEIYDSYRGVRSSNIQRRAAALEFLDNALATPLKRVILPVLEETSLERLRPVAKEVFGLQAFTSEQCLQEWMRGDDPWLKIVALYRAGELPMRSLEAEMRSARSDPDSRVSETATFSLNRMERGHA